MKLFYCNINSLIGKKHDMEDTINSCKPDIICLNETLLTDKTDWQEYKSGFRKYSNNFHILKGENVKNTYNLKNVIPFRGISIFTTDDCDASLIRQYDDNEIVVIKFTTPNNRTFVLILGYLSPSIKSNSKIDSFFEKIIEQVNATSPKDGVIIIGDFNAKDNTLFPTNSPNYAGKILSNVLNNIPIGPNHLASKRNLLNRVQHATRSNDKTGKGNLLDFIITDINEKHLDVSHLTKISDHDCLLVDLDHHPKKQKDVPLIKTKLFNYEKADIDGLRKDLLNINFRINDHLKKKLPLKPRHTTHERIKKQDKSNVIAQKRLKGELYE